MRVLASGNFSLFFPLDALKEKEKKRKVSEKIKNRKKILLSFFQVLSVEGLTVENWTFKGFKDALFFVQKVQEFLGIFL